MNEAEQILDFWIEIGPKKWWTKDDAVDAEIRNRFGDVHTKAAGGGLDDWMNEPDSALALIIVLDQFSRNMNRNSPLAFAQDTRCVHLVRALIASGADSKMREDLRSFCYLPLMHSEHPSDQQLCLEKMAETGSKENVEAAEEHLEIIERFGRFPHRNKVLGRTTTPAEQAFLDDGGFSG